MRYLGLLCLTAAILVPGGTAAPTGITLGVLLPSNSIEAESMRRGIALAVAQKSTATQKVHAVMRERGSQWGADGQEAAEMVLDDTAQGIIAPSDGATTHLALQVAGRTGTPVVSLSSDCSVLGAGIPWSLRIAPGTTEQALAIFTNVTARRWCALVADGRSGREASRDLSAAAKAAGRQLVVIAAANPARAAHAARTNAAGALFVWFNDSAEIRDTVQRLRGNGFRGPIAVPFTFANVTPGLLTAEPELDGPAAAQFHSDYLQRFGTAPNITSAMAFDAATVLLELLDGSGPAAFQQRAMALNRPGASGPLRFDNSGNRLLPLHFHVPSAHPSHLTPLTSQ